MSRDPGSRVARFAWLATATFTLILASASIGWAEPPAQKDCSDQTDAFQRLDCRHDGLAEQMERTADLAFGEGTPLSQRAAPAHLKHIRRAGKKATRAKHRSSARRFKKLAKAEARGNEAPGHLVPLDPEDDLLPDGPDGICDYEQGNDQASCAAIELDSNDQLQECNPKKKNKGKGHGQSGQNPKFEGLECDRSFDEEEAANEGELEEMEEAADAIEETFDTVENDFVEMNQRLEDLNQNLPAATVRFSRAANGCLLPELTPGLAETVAFLRPVVAGAKGAASIVDSSTGQTVVGFGFGGNGRAAAVIADAAASVVEIAYITVELIYESERSLLQDAIADCVIQVAGDISALQAELTAQHAQIRQNDDANRDMILQRVEEVREELVALLNTPQGQRTYWPRLFRRSTR